jgi:hypothetical protein
MQVLVTRQLKKHTGYVRALRETSREDPGLALVKHQRSNVLKAANGASVG